MLAGAVTEAWHYPIKSLGGCAVTHLHLDARGAAGDRALAVYDVDGKIGSGKSTRRFRRIDGLLECSVDVDDAGTITLRTPVAGPVVAPSPEADAALSEFLGQRVRLQHEVATAHFDVGALHLLSSSSLEWLGDRLGGPVPTARFRPNLLIRTAGAPPHVEDGWVGGRLTVGSAVLEVTERTQRCVMVTMPQPGLPSDERILRLLADERDGCFGVYASVIVPGTIHLGDSVEVLP